MAVNIPYTRFCKKHEMTAQVSRSNQKFFTANILEGKVIMRLDSVYLIQKAKMQDMLRAAEQDRLLQLAKLHNSNQTGLHRNLAAWMGVQMVKWGAKLQRYGSASTAVSPAAAQTEYLPN
jgi:hypothetical protein